MTDEPEHDSFSPRRPREHEFFYRGSQPQGTNSNSDPSVPPNAPPNAPFGSSSLQDPLSSETGPSETALLGVEPIGVATEPELAGEEAGEGKKRRFGLLFDLVAVVVLGVLLALVLHMFVTRVYAISGQSMLPTFHDGEKVMIHRLSPSLVSVGRGDVIIFSNPDDPTKNLIKRVIATSGETIEIIQGAVYIDGVELLEDYARVLPRSYGSRLAPRQVPDGKIFVLGDNRPASKDSRHFHSTFVDLEAIKGKVFLRWWPLDQFTTFP